MKNIYKLSLILIPILLVSCGPITSQEASEVLEQEAIMLTHTPTIDGVKVRTAETFYTNPSRVATFNFGVLDMIDTIGVEQFGIKDLGLAKASVPLALGHYDDEQFVDVGTLFEPNYLALDLFDPQLIVLDGRSAALYQTMKQRYPTADVLDATLTTYSYATQNEVARNLALIFPQAKEEIVENLELISSDIAAIKAVAQNHQALFVLSNGDSLTAYGDSGRYSSLHLDFGFKTAVDNIASQAQHGQAITKEFLTENDPEIIFIMDRAAAIGETSGLESFLADPLVKTLTAYENNNIYALSAQAWYTVTGGFTSTRQMIVDIDQFTNIF